MPAARPSAGQQQADDVRVRHAGQEHVRPDRLRLMRRARIVRAEQQDERLPQEPGVGRDLAERREGHAAEWPEVEAALGADDQVRELGEPDGDDRGGEQAPVEPMWPPGGARRRRAGAP